MCYITKWAMKTNKYRLKNVNIVGVQSSNFSLMQGLYAYFKNKI